MVLQAEETETKTGKNWEFLCGRAPQGLELFNAAPRVSLGL